ncbi:MAG: hypothetical protein OXT07_01820 [bacterium]|nr:hypothetical protein [bacterium]
MTMDIQHQADASGGLAWISEQLFGLQGRLAAEGEALDAQTRALLARSSRRCGQHAQWWRDLLPDSPALDGTGRVRPPTEAWAGAVGYIEEAPLADAVAALYEVALAQLLVVLRELQNELSPIGDGAFIRTARIVLADLEEEEADAKRVWPLPTIPSTSDTEKLWRAFSRDDLEKRWPPLVTRRPQNGYH